MSAPTADDIMQEEKLELATAKEGTKTKTIHSILAIVTVLIILGGIVGIMYAARSSFAQSGLIKASTSLESFGSAEKLLVRADTAKKIKDMPDVYSRR